VRSYGPRFDGGDQTARVSQAHEYTRKDELWSRSIGSGRLSCRMLRAASGPARRIVQLVAEYDDRGVAVVQVVDCKSEEEEKREAFRLEGLIRYSNALPSSAG
jgi:hypothetical protein